MISFRTLSCRFYHTSKSFFASSASTSSLARLRKSTGFSVSNCKKALENFPNDLQKAEEWLHSEAKKMGWSKWDKIQNRKAVQGLIGVYAKDNLGIMVEVNCETDFVARNTEFKSLVGNVLFGCLENIEQYKVDSDNELQKFLLAEADLMNLKFKSFSAQELLNSAMSKFNERTVLKRAVVLKANSSAHVSGVTHPCEECSDFPQVHIGKFGTLVAYQPKVDADSESRDFGTNMCQHIIGMNPLSIGAEDFEQMCTSEKLKEEELPHPIENDNLPQDIDNDVEVFKSDLKDSDEARLLFQPYLLEPNLKVHEYISKQARILDFERFECGGESKDSEEMVKASCSI